MNDRAKTRRRVRAPASAIRESAGKRPPTGFALFDRDWRLVAANVGLAELRGYPRKLLKTGTPLEAFVRFDVGRGEYGKGAIDALTRARLTALKRGRPAVREQPLPDGRCVRIVCERLADGGLLLICEDATEARAAAERLRQSEECYDFAMRAINEGVYDWDIAGGTVYYSDRVRQVLGLPTDKLKTVADWRARIHPDDLARLDACHVAHFKGETERFECDHRYRGSDGSWRWARQHGLALRDARGRAYRMVGSTGDITELKTRELELAERTAEQAAVRELLEAISRTAFDLDAVLRTLIASAARLCEAHDAHILQVRGDALYVTASHGEFPITSPSEPVPITRGLVSGRAVLERQLVHVLDITSAEARAEFPESARYQQRFGDRTLLAMPLLRESTPIGLILMRRLEVRPFTDRQISLLKTFADQAVIAVENVRLFQELQGRNRELSEALEQQTATAEILRVISESPRDLRPVFDAILDRATLLCEAQLGVLFQFDGERYQIVATRGGEPAAITRWKEEFPAIGRPGPRSGLGRLLADKRPVHIPDILEEAAYHEGDVLRLQTANLLKARTILAVPLLKDGAVVGAVVIYRRDVRPFTDKQIALVGTFADQAVIAVENVRLFNETKEALDQLKASAEVLQVISSSVADTQPVFDKILESCQRLFEGRNVGITLVGDDGAVHLGPYRGFDRRELEGMYPLPLSRASGSGSAILERRVMHYPDVERGDGVPEPVRHGSRIIGLKSIVFAPMLWEGRGIGAIFVGRATSGEFSEKEIALLKTFADQAVIAIQNARLFNETKEALERQTATAEILRVISSSPTDVKLVFEEILRAAARLCQASIATVFRFDGKLAHLAATHNWPAEALAAIVPRYPMPPDPEVITGRVILSGKVVRLVDAYNDPYPAQRSGAKHGGWRRMLGVPMVREGAIVGAIVVAWPEPGETPDRQVELLQTFADQAVIAIENVRLFDEVQARTREVQESLEFQTATSEVLKAISRSTFDLRAVLETLVSTAMRLCRADMAQFFRLDGDAFRWEAGAGINADYLAIERASRIPLDRGTLVGRTGLERRAVHVHDALADPEYVVKDEALVGGVRTMLGVPLMRGGQLFGVFAIARARVEPFERQQIELVGVFADQAVIAMENVRLFNETKEALEQQKASAQVLEVISSSVADTKPVFEKIVESCERLFEGRNVGISLVAEDGAVQLAAYHGPNREELERHYPIPLTEESGSGAAILQRRVVHYPDVQRGAAVPDYVRRGARITGYKSMMLAPMLWEGRGIGAIFVGRAVVGEFSDKEIGLLKTFADQAVIAIQNARLFNETKEALEQQTATADILKVISRSPTDVQPVFEAIVQSGVRLFENAAVAVVRPEHDRVRLMAIAEGDSQKAALWRSRFPFTLTREYMHGAAILDCEMVDVPDVLALTDRFEAGRQNFLPSGYRAITIAPMVRDNIAIGAISVIRMSPGPLGDKQLVLLKTFADQAVIAIENVRLFNELEARNRELTESLEQQTATAEILRVISSSPTDIVPVLDAVAENAARLCDAHDVVIMMNEGDVLRAVKSSGSFGERFGTDFTIPITPGSAAGRAVVERRTVRVADFALESEDEYPVGREHQRIYGNHGAMATPLLRGDAVLGVIAVLRRDVRPFSDRQSALLQTFADQAAIAIANVRLFNETKEALERQTATAEILKVISESPTDVQPVFDAIVSHAGRLALGSSVNVSRMVGDQLHLAAYTRVSPEADEALKSFYPIGIGEVRSTIAEAVRSRTSFLVSDHETDPRVSPKARAVMRARGFRSTLYMPLVRGDVVHGVMHVSRVEPGPFPEQWVSLLKTFADQAVIAIENVRLFNETKEALEQQTATADILKVMSASPTDVQPVFDAIANSGVRLFQGVAVSLRVVKGDRIERVAFAAAPGCEVSVDSTNAALPLDDRSFAGRAVLQRKLIHVPDIPAADWVGEASRTANERMGARAIAVAPMLRENKVLGAIAVTRARTGPFSDKDLALLTTFADQAVIAIENVRLFNETKEALDHQKTSAEVLQVISSSVADAAPVFDKILESCQRLFGGHSVGIPLVGEDGRVHLGAYQGRNREKFERNFPTPFDGSGTGAAIAHGRVMRYPDVDAPNVPAFVRLGATAIGCKSVIFAPMLWEGRGVGAIFVGRDAVGEFSEKEIALLKTFADQAVIAIQNAKLFREIREKSHQLEIANQHKSAFLANMSHELRTPLNAVIGFSEMLAARYFGNLTDKQAEYVGDIHASGRHLLSLINDILDLSKIEAGRMELEEGEFDLRAALDNALTLVRERAQRSGVALRLETDPALGAFRGDERKVKQVVLNLLSNAVKFTPRGGAVDVVARKANGSAEIAVSDTGVGITPADQEAIFEAFRQVGTDVTRKREGTGLGLALSRRFVELHGGTIRVESEPGKGSKFTVTLPLRHGE